jgi:hypothetical protein
MKRYSPILFIWLFSFIGSLLCTYLAFIGGSFNELIAWGTSTTFITNLIIYHLYITRR